MGENGAGKPTLGKIIGGAIRPSGGQLFVAGEERTYASPYEALKDGIASIQQEIALVPKRSVLENIFLGHGLRAKGLPSNSLMRQRLKEKQAAIGFDLEPDRTVAELSTANQQKVEILRAVMRDARVIVMDEPTASLGINEVEGLLATVRQLKASGKTVIFVSHRLGEVMAVPTGSPSCETEALSAHGRRVKRAPVHLSSRCWAAP